MRSVVVDPRIIAAGFLDARDQHGIYRLLGLLAYGRVCQYVQLMGKAEEDELRKQSGSSTGRWRRGPRLRNLLADAKDQRAALANRLPPETTPTDLVLACSLALLDEVKLEIDRADASGHFDDPELGLRAQRVTGSITGALVDGLGEDERRFRRINEEMLAATAQAGAMLVTQSESLAPEEGEIYPRVAPGSRAPVEVVRLWTFVDREVNRYPFDLMQNVPYELLNVACRWVPPTARVPPTA